MAEIKIDSGVPVPRVPGGRGGYKYPWRAMKVGDSFFVPSAVTAMKYRTSPDQFQMSVAGARRVVPGSEWVVRGVTENGSVASACGE